MYTCLYLLGICVCSYEIDSVQTCLCIVFFFFVFLKSLYETVFSRLSVLLINSENSVGGVKMGCLSLAKSASCSKASLSKASLLFTKPADNTFIPFYSRRSWTEWGTVEHCAAAVWTGPNLVSVAAGGESNEHCSSLQGLDLKLLPRDSYNSL